MKSGFIKIHFDIHPAFYIILKLFGNITCLYTLCSENSKKEKDSAYTDFSLVNLRLMDKKSSVLVEEKDDMSLL